MQIDVNEVFTLYKRHNNAYKMCNEIFSVKILKINKRSYSCLKIASDEKITINFKSNYEIKGGKWIKTYIPGTFEGYEVSKYGEEETLYKEFNMLKKLEKSRKMQVITTTSWYGATCSDSELERLKKEVEKLNKIINEVETGRKLEQETKKEISNYLKNRGEIE